MSKQKKKKKNYDNKKSFNSRSGKFKVHINVFNIIGPPPIVLEPQRQRSADLKIEEETFPLIHINVFA